MLHMQGFLKLTNFVAIYQRYYQTVLTSKASYMEPTTPNQCGQNPGYQYCDREAISLFSAHSLLLL